MQGSTVTKACKSKTEGASLLLPSLKEDMARKRVSRTQRRWQVATTVPSMEALKEIFNYWNPRSMMIDANPEIHAVMDLKNQFKHLYASKFQHGQLIVNVNREDRIMSMDRTAAMDALKEEIEKELMVLPEGAEEIPDYYSHLKASTRILIANEKNPERSYFSWEHSMPDHFHLAEVYCLQADSLIPRDSAIDYYTALAKGQDDKAIEEKKKQTGLSEEELIKLQSVSPDSFLNGIKGGRR